MIQWVMKLDNGVLSLIDPDGSAVGTVALTPAQVAMFGHIQNGDQISMVKS
jgi:hypothetical protein